MWTPAGRLQSEPWPLSRSEKSVCCLAEVCCHGRVRHQEGVGWGGKVGGVTSPLFGVALRALHVLFFLTEQSEPRCFYKGSKTIRNVITIKTQVLLEHWLSFSCMTSHMRRDFFFLQRFHFRTQLFLQGGEKNQAAPVERSFLVVFFRLS